MITVKRRHISPEFGIIVTDKTNGLYLRELMNIIMEKSTKPLEATILQRMEPGDVIIFDTPQNGSAVVKLVDYRKVSTLGDKFDNIKLYDLVEDFTKITKALKNYFNVIEKSRKAEPKTVLEALLLMEEDDGFDIGTILFTERRKERKQKRERRHAWEKQTLNGKSVDIYEYWVKIGTEQYDIFVDDETDEEYIRINGNVVYIDRSNPNYPYLYSE